MADITIIKKDEAHLKVICEPSIAQELHNHFSFEVPGAKFHPMYRSKMWDGKMRLFSMFTKELYVGLKSYLEHFAEANQYSVDLEKYVDTTDSATPNVVNEFLNTLHLASKEKLLEIREYQVNAILKAITDGRRLLLSPTGSGKSLIIYSLLRWHEQFNRKQLILVPTTSLVEQLYSDFQDYSSINGWRASENIHKIYSGLEKTIDMPIVISTWQSLYKLPKTFFSNFQVIYGDECHLFKAKSLSSIMNKCTNSPYRIGTTGTLDGTKVHKLVLEGLFGPIYKTTTTKNLIDTNQLANLKIFAVILDHNSEIKKACKGFTYQQEMDFLVQHEQRNKFIRNLALKQKGNTLVLFQYVEKHGKTLIDMIRSKTEERKVFFIHGGTETQQREETRQIVENESDAIIVASYGTFSTGVNLKNLHNIIFASPSKSKIRNLQSIGRGLRMGDRKTECKLYDIGDDISWKSRKNFTLLHMAERIKIYADEQFDYSLVRVNL